MNPHLQHHSLSSTTTAPIAKADSGATGHYAMPDHQHLLKNCKPCSGPTVTIPNGDTIVASKQGQLPFSNKLSPSAKQAFVLDNLKSASLVSLGQLCDDGCIVTLTKSTLQVIKNNEVIMTGHRNFNDGLWDIPLQQDQCPPRPPKSTIRHSVNVIINHHKTKSQLVKFLHAACFSPATSTFLRAFKNGNFITWPGLTEKLITKFLPTSEATIKGHLNQERKNQQSTKNPSSALPTTTSNENEEDEDDFFPQQDVPNVKTHDCCGIMLPFETTSTAYSDLTGRFPHQSSRGNQYLLVIYDYDSNAILVEPLKNRAAGTIRTAWEKLHNLLRQRGCAPNLYILDNEISTDFKSALSKYELDYQRVPPHTHRRNKAERAIQTFKNHFLAGLASVHPLYPIAEWDRLLFQATTTLNLLRNSRVNPKLSAYAYLFGNFDYNKTPLVPPGTKVIIHRKPQQRATWDFHGKDGFTIGPSMEHYRCIQCFVPAKRSTIDVDTVTFIPHNIPFPETSTEDHLNQAASDILAILQNPPSSLPFLESGNDTTNAIEKIAQLLRRATTKTPPTLPTPPQPAPSPPTSSPRVPVPTPPASSPRVPTQPPAPAPRVPAPSPSPAAPPTVAPAPSNLPPKPSPLPTSLPTNTTAKKHYERQPFRTPSIRQNFQRRRLQHHAQHIFAQPHVNHIYNEQGKKETLQSLRTGPNKEIWERALSNEYGRLAQGNDFGVQGTNTIKFVHKQRVPSNRRVTYANFVCDYRPLKSEPNRVRMVVGGDKLDYHEDAASPAASLLETKILINSTISDAHRGAKFLSCDLKDFFLATPMDRPEYMRIPISNFPQDIITKYKLLELLSDDGHIYVEIQKGMYGLIQAAVLAYNQLVSFLYRYGYYPVPHCVGVWRHKTRRTRFCLCVDDFGVKYFSKLDADHLLNSLRNHYKISVDWEGRNFCGLTFTWNYKEGYVDTEMSGYLPKLLDRLNHPTPEKPCHSPFPWSPPVYGAKTQYAPTDDVSPRLDAKGIKEVQSIVGSILYYARAIDPTMLPALNELGAQQTKATERPKTLIKQLLDYCATYPNAVIRYYASDMILFVDSDAAYLVLPGAKSRISGHFFLSDQPPPAPATPSPRPNGPIMVICRTLRHVVNSVAEAETAGVFINANEAIPCRYILEALDHPQPATPLETDNSTTNSFCHSTMRQKRSKSWDMRYHWLRDKETQKIIRVYWKPGKLNRADYFSKHHPPSHHQKMRPKYIHMSNLIQQTLRQLQRSDLVQGCVDHHLNASPKHVTHPRDSQSWRSFPGLTNANSGSIISKS